ncbi:MAG: glycosyltransferase, partial [Phycisphaeraceae bacterium]|nr:glycosyltransferase [Phycisphaeraceae bacterium]
TEAMATGLRALGRGLGGIPEVVLDGLNGLVVDERDEPGSAEALACFSDEDRRLEAAARARGMAETRFDSKAQGDEFISLLGSIAASKAGNEKKA